MDDLIEWLRAQLDVDEASGEADAFPPPGYADADRQARGVRMLAEVEAKRKIVDLATKTREWTEGSAGATAGYAAAIVSDTLRLLALPYAAEPGYREEWRP